MNKTITISIGRAVGTTPMNTKKWRNFIRLVNTLVADTVSPDSLWVNNAKSHNNWGTTPEESRTWVFDTDSHNIEQLDVALDVLRIDFGQEAIARTAGKTRLVGIN